ncbi:hypothetical protein ABT278_08225 [Streptomyces sp. NPDC001228]
MGRAGHWNLNRFVPHRGEPSFMQRQCPVLFERLESEPFQTLRTLKLPREDFVVAGSAPLFIRGLRNEISDLDIVTNDVGWERARSLAEAHNAPYGEVESVPLFQGRIEVLNGWFPHLFGTVPALMTRTEVIGGFRFLTLADTALWKRDLDREKDRADLLCLYGSPVGEAAQAETGLVRSGPSWKRIACAAGGTAATAVGTAVITLVAAHRSARTANAAGYAPGLLDGAEVARNGCDFDQDGD